MSRKGGLFHCKGADLPLQAGSGMWVIFLWQMECHPIFTVPQQSMHPSPEALVKQRLAALCSSVSLYLWRFQMHSQLHSDISLLLSKAHKCLQHVTGSCKNHAQHLPCTHCRLKPCVIAVLLDTISWCASACSERLHLLQTVLYISLCRVPTRPSS